ncbi:unnamed protein product, partial [Laminaria digitata]
AAADDHQQHWDVDYSAVSGAESAAAAAAAIATASASAAAATAAAAAAGTATSLVGVSVSAGEAAKAEGDRRMENYGSTAFQPSSSGARFGAPEPIAAARYEPTLDTLAASGATVSGSDFEGAVDGILGGVSPGGVAFPSPPHKAMPYPTSKISAAVKSIDWEGGAEWEGLGSSSFGESPAGSPRRSGFEFHNVGSDSG